MRWSRTNPAAGVSARADAGQQGAGAAVGIVEPQQATAAGSPDQLATAAAPASTRAGARPVAFLRVLRPTQWTKNGLVALALIFAGKLSDPAAIGRVALAFAAFALAASAVYVINDIADREHDRQHPRKRFRPIAARSITLAEAWVLAALCLAGAAALAYLLVQQIPVAQDPFAQWGGSRALFVGALGGYVALNLLYSHGLKHVVLLDVFLIAAGFVLRGVAGAFVLPAPISPWFYLCITFGALFLALGKRRAELVLLSDAAALHRRNLQQYTLVLVDQLLVIVVTCTLISYSLYTFQAETASHSLMLTIPLVLFGVFRYLYLVYVKAAGERPDELLWRDRQILATVVLWGMVVFFLLYVLPSLRALHLSAPWT
jgi:4-hydroxybenzoate polyprenyltransferase